MLFQWNFIIVLNYIPAEIFTKNIQILKEIWRRQHVVSAFYYFITNTKKYGNIIKSIYVEVDYLDIVDDPIL